MSSPNKVLALDLGEKRIGLAVGYLDGLSFPLKTIKTKADIVGQLKKEIGEISPGLLIVGLPLSADGQETNQSRWVKKIISKLDDEVEIEIKYLDEYLTSWQSKEGGAMAEDIDQQSALILLKDYFSEKS